MSTTAPRRTDLSRPAGGAPSRLILTVRDTSALTGCSERSVWQWIERGEIPVVRIGRCTRIRVADLERFIDQRTQRTSGEPR
jgi:excisionase family DNA binding protein